MIKHHLPCVLAAVAVVILTVTVRPAAAASSCEDLAQRSTVNLIARHSADFDQQTATYDEMDRLAVQLGIPATTREAHPLMLIIAQAGTDVEMAHQTIESHSAVGNASFCDAPPSVLVTIGAFKSRIILHRSAAADSCIRQALLKHLLQHKHVLDKTIDSFVEAHRNGLARAVHDLIQKRRQMRPPRSRILRLVWRPSFPDYTGNLRGRLSSHG